jgi:hypothetical protein
MRNFISLTVTLSVYKTVNDPIQQYPVVHCAVGYDELRWTSVSNNLSHIYILQMSNILSEANCSLCVVAAFCVHSVESDEGVWGKEEFDIYRAGEG